jgi:hypothetical protein
MVLAAALVQLRRAKLRPREAPMRERLIVVTRTRPPACRALWLTWDPTDGRAVAVRELERDGDGEAWTEAFSSAEGSTAETFAAARVEDFTRRARSQGFVLTMDECGKRARGTIPN